MVKFMLVPTYSKAEAATAGRIEGSMLGFATVMFDCHVTTFILPVCLFVCLFVCLYSVGDVYMQATMMLVEQGMCALEVC